MNKVILMSGIAALNSSALAHNQTYACSNSDFTSAFPDSEITPIRDYLNTCPETDAERILFERFTNIEVGRRYEYMSVGNKMMTETDDSDLRALCAEYKIINCDPGTEVRGKTMDKGLAKCLDPQLIPGGEAGMDRAIQLELQDKIDAMTCQPNTGIMGRQVRSLRKKSYRDPAITNSEIAANASFTDAEFADFIGVDNVFREDLQTQGGSKKAKEWKAGLKASFFNSGERILTPDGLGAAINPVSVARFWTPADQGSIAGGRWGLIVEKRQRNVLVAVFHYSETTVVNADSVLNILYADGFGG